VQDWIKLLGTQEEPYTQAAHTLRDHGVVLFRQKRVAVKRGDRMFLYVILPRGNAFIGLSTAIGRPAPHHGDPRWPTEVRVIPNLTVFALEAAVPARSVMPLPGGVTAAVLRRRSHVRIPPEAAARLLAVLRDAVAAELEGRATLLPGGYGA